MKLFVMFSMLTLSMAALAEIKSEAIVYKEGDTQLEGYLAYDPTLAGKRPGILVVHDWMGVGKFVKGRVDLLAKLGFIAFAPDIYGKDVRPKNPREAAELAGRFKKDRALMRRRALAGLEQLKKQKSVDPLSLATIGYCFGGTVALEVARAGANVKGIVSFHGGLDATNLEEGKNIKGKVLVLHGADDPFVPADQVKAFEDEMRAGKVDWELVKYSNAVHAFTNPEAGSDNSKGAAYNPEADHRSWQAMKDFFTEIFGKS